MTVALVTALLVLGAGLLAAGVRLEARSKIEVPENPQVASVPAGNVRPGGQ